MKNTQNIDFLQPFYQIRDAHSLPTLSDLAPTKSTGPITGCVEMENGTVQKGQNLLEDFVWPIDTGRLMGDLPLLLTLLCLRPIVLIALCLIFGITPADPEFSIQRLACLTGTGFAPAGIYDLAWPH
jgi:hypothetical protein